MKYDFDSIVIGAGVVGLAIARSLANSGRTVLLLEENPNIGQGISSRNSEVIHAGIYYPIDSLKRELCIKGRLLLIDYCKSHNINFNLVGKLIVASNEHESKMLSSILETGIKNGVADLEMIGENCIESIEPNLKAIKAILSPSTGIVDSHSLMLSLQGDFESDGGIVSFNSSATSIKKINDGFLVSVNEHDSFGVSSRELINSAGLSAQNISQKIDHLDKSSIPKSRFCKGSYFSLACKSPFSHLIYPVPNNAGLGVHLTLDLAGRAKFGPDTEWVDSPEYSVNTKKIDQFYNAIRKYYPALQKNDLTPDYAGVRPKIVDKGESAADFMIQSHYVHKINGLIALYGIESPGLTSSLAIGDYVKDKLDEITH